MKIVALIPSLAPDEKLVKLTKQLEKDKIDVVIVNDGSEEKYDEIFKQCSGHLISYRDNKGKGYAVRRGMLAAKSEYVAFLDSDLEIPPYLLEGFLRSAYEENADVVIGSKMHKDSKIEYPFLRKIMSYGYYYFMKMLFGLKVKDTQTGIKMFRTSKALPVLKAMRTSRFSFDIELLAISSKLNYKIIEMPVVVNFSRNKANRSRIRIRSIFEMIRDSFRIKFYLSHFSLQGGDYGKKRS